MTLRYEQTKQMVSLNRSIKARLFPTAHKSVCVLVHQTQHKHPIYTTDSSVVSEL